MASVCSNGETIRASPSELYFMKTLKCERRISVKD